MNEGSTMHEDLDLLISGYLDGEDPVPDGDLCFVGDGDYREIGAEFLGHFVRFGGLTPNDRVLEIGCGVGRMAMPLRRYLSADGRYHGMDVVARGIEWCRGQISARDSRFGFSHQNLYHPLYNPSGRETATTACFPADDSSVDFVVAASLFTHLSRPVLERYVDEVARILTPRGRLFATFFLINDATRRDLATGGGRYQFDLTEPGPLFRSAADSGMLSSVAVDEAWLMDRFAAAGLVPRLPVQHGFWASGNPERGAGFQDIGVLGPKG